MALIKKKMKALDQIVNIFMMRKIFLFPKNFEQNIFILPHGEYYII